MTNTLVRKYALTVFLAILSTLIFINPLLSYDRQAIVGYNGYIDAHWDLENYNPLFSNYSNEGGDCANFGSQCIIAGGIRFVKGSPDIQNPGFWLEKGSNQGKIDAHDSNIWAQGLRSSLKSARHGAEEYTFLHFSIKPGDIIFLTENGSAYHTLIVRQRIGNEIWVAAHTESLS